MKSQRNKIDRLDLFVGCLVISVIALFSLWLYPWGRVVTEDWNALQNSNSAVFNEKDKFNASLEIVKAIVSGAGTIAAVAGGFVVYLNFRVANRNAEIANRNAEIAESRLIAERFSKAVEQLGSDKLEVCLGGIFSLEKIAIDSLDYHWTIMEVLTGFTREISLVTSDNVNIIRNSLTYKAAIQTAVTVIGRRIISQDPSEKILDLSYANLSGLTIRGNFSRASFIKAKLEKSDLQGGIFESADFRDANLENANLSRANLKHTIFIDANLSHTTIIDGDLELSRLKGAFLYWANLRNANLQGADLSDARIQNASFAKAKFKRANLSGMKFWYLGIWDRRHRTEEDIWLEEECLREERRTQGNQYYYDDDIPSDEYHRKADFRLADGLEVEQLQGIEGHDNAVYDEPLRKLLGLPEYAPSEIRELPEGISGNPEQ